MDFSFTDEQEMLRAQARTFLADKFPPERLAEVADAAGWDSAAYKEMASLGWIGLSLPEDAGGAGMSFLDEAVLIEELGRALSPVPYFSSAVLCSPALESAPNAVGSLVSGEETWALAFAEPGGPHTLDDLDAVDTKAEPDGGSWALSGEKVLISDLNAATKVVVVARSSDGVALFATDASGDVAPTVDSTRPLGSMRLAGDRAVCLAAPNDAARILGRIRLRAFAGLAVEAVGVAQRALDLAVEHAKTRTQFGRPIGAYQAVSHQIADIYMDTELARSLAYWAAWCVASEDEGAAVAAAAAKAFAASAAVRACERSIQVHGGIGFTWEHVLHRLYKRAQWVEAFGGFPSARRAEIAAALLDGV
jgi:alkylation response protein AidB-like acyl-CoA dehydrogenase